MAEEKRDKKTKNQREKKGVSQKRRKQEVGDRLREADVLLVEQRHLGRRELTLRASTPAPAKVFNSLGGGPG